MCGNNRENVLLVNPPQSFDRKGASEGLAPPLGLLYLKAMMPHGNTTVLDLSVSENPRKTFEKTFESEEWDIVGITVLTYSLNPVRHMVNWIKPHDTYLVAGGPHATLIPSDCLKMGFDAVVVGEGELIINDLVRKKPTGIIQGEPVKNLDEIPLPDRSCLEKNMYGVFGFLRMPGLSTSIMTSRGCPYNCRFCGRIVKGYVRRRSAESVIKELKELKKQEYENIFITDDHFITNRKWVKAFCRALKREKLKFNFFYQTRIDNFDKESARTLREVGTQYISFGIESVNPDVLQFYNKTENPSKWQNLVEEVLGYCNDTGIYSQASLIIGAPMETEEMFWESYDFVSKSGADTINVNPLVYFVGSDIWRDAVKKGIIEKDEYLTSVSDRELCPIPPKRIAEIHDEVFYKVTENIRKRVLLKTLRHMDRFRMRVLSRGAIEFIQWKLQCESWRRSHDTLKEFGYGKGGPGSNVKRGL
jgi:anaerobic magnesium-protoporphyrin IX monomethyl ester cyclase